MKHTPFPWTLDNDEPRVTCSIDGTGSSNDEQPICVFKGPDAVANSAFVFRACTLFDELVGACEELAKAARTFDTKLHAGFKVEELTEDQSRLYNATNDAKAVIAKAKATK